MELRDLTLKDIKFSNCHLVALWLFNNDAQAAEGLAEEIQARMFLNIMDKNSVSFTEWENKQ